MKLVMVFLLAAIPACCYASGSGCNAMDDAIAKTIDPSVSKEEYQTVISSYAALPYDKNALDKFKQCFLDQSDETLENVEVMTQAIYDSAECL